MTKDYTYPEERRDALIERIRKDVENLYPDICAKCEKDITPEDGYYTICPETCRAITGYDGNKLCMKCADKVGWSERRAVHCDKEAVCFA